MSTQFIKDKKNILVLLNRIAHGGQNTLMFIEIIIDVSLCPYVPIMFYTGKKQQKIVESKD